AEDGIRDPLVTGVQTCALPISPVITVTEAPSCSAGVSVRVAVTTTGSACLTSCACAVLTMTASTTTAIHDVQGMPDSFFRERVEIGRASCRERGEIAEVCWSSK